jgi:hypothetical protein
MLFSQLRRSSMSGVDCPFCEANLPPEELADRWCETCGKKLPALLRGPGAGGLGRPLSREQVPARSPSGLRIGLGVLGILVGLLCFTIGLSHLPTILKEGAGDPQRAAGRLTGVLCCSGLPFGQGLYALLRKDRPRSPRRRDHWTQGEVPSRKPFPVALLILGVVVGLPLLACAGFALLVVKMSPIPRTTPTTAVRSNGTIIKSNDGSIQMQVPAGWSLATGLNAQAELQVRSPRRDVGLVVLTDLKTDLRKGMTYREHSELTLNTLLKTLGEGTIVRGPTDLVFNARPALQYEIHGFDKNTRFAALHTTIDGRDSFHQVFVTTTPSGLERNRTTLQEIINSFTENK